MLYCIKSCTVGSLESLDLYIYSGKFPKAVTLVENDPHLADKSS